MDELTRDYLKNHSHLEWHYVSGCFDTLFLGFGKEWMGSQLPATATPRGLSITLLDQQDGRIYQAYHPPYYSECCYDFVSKEGERVVMNVLNMYMFDEHYCPCHRKQDAKLAGAIVENLDCDGDRFLIERITPLNSTLILASETIQVDELESLLLVPPEVL